MAYKVEDFDWDEYFVKLKEKQDYLNKSRMIEKKIVQEMDDIEKKLLKENLEKVEDNEPLTEPLRKLNLRCDFKKQWQKRKK